MAAPANLESPKGLGSGLALGSGWSGPTCKVLIDHTRLAQSFVPTSPEHEQKLQRFVRISRECLAAVQSQHYQHEKVFILVPC